MLFDAVDRDPILGVDREDLDEEVLEVGREVRHTEDARLDLSGEPTERGVIKRKFSLCVSWGGPFRLLLETKNGCYDRIEISILSY